MDGITYALFSSPNNEKIISELRNQKKNVFLIPNIETQKIELDKQQKNTLLNSANYDWIIFTDVFTVDYFIEFLEENDFDLYELDKTRICAFGEVVADRLRFSAIHSDIITTSIETGKIFASIRDYLVGVEFSGLRFLILKESIAFLKLTEKIRNINSEVVEIALYEILVNEYAAIAKIKALILGGAIDEIIFSDPTDLVNFKKIFADLYNQNNFFDTKFSATNEVMLQMLLENGFQSNYFNKDKRG